MLTFAPVLTSYKTKTLINEASLIIFSSSLFYLNELRRIKRKSFRKYMSSIGTGNLAAILSCANEALAEYHENKIQYLPYLSFGIVKL